MTNIYVAERALDVSPMIEALKYQPFDFEFSGGWLVHVPSRHRFSFDHRGRLTIDAHCGCAALRARREQQADLKFAFDQWRENYWRIVETDREFASHFAPVGRWRRFVRDVRMAYRRLRRRPDAARYPAAPAPVAVPAE